MALRPLVRDRRPQRGRALLPRRALLPAPRRVDGGDLQHLQHAQALARAVPARRPALAHRVLRARALQPHPRLERPRHRRRHLLRVDEAGRLAHVLDAGELVLVLRGDRDGEPGALRRGDLRPLRRQALRAPVRRIRAQLAREGASPAPGDALPSRRPGPLAADAGPIGTIPIERAPPGLGGIRVRGERQRSALPDRRHVRGLHDDRPRMEGRRRRGRARPDEPARRADARRRVRRGVPAGADRAGRRPRQRARHREANRPVGARAARGRGATDSDAHRQTARARRSGRCSPPASR